MWVSFVTMVDCLWRWRVQESPVHGRLCPHFGRRRWEHVHCRTQRACDNGWDCLGLRTNMSKVHSAVTVKKLGCCRTVQVDRLWHNSLFGLWRTKSETRPDCDLSYIVLRLQQINTVSYTLCLRFEKFFSVQKYLKNNKKKRFFFSEMTIFGIFLHDCLLKIWQHAKNT